MVCECVEPPAGLHEDELEGKVEKINCSACGSAVIDERIFLT